MYLIIGRTATGKDELQNILVEKYGWKAVKSYTTRPMRTAKENTHIFIADEKAKSIPIEEKAAYTQINGYEYFATKEQVKGSDVYIIDPNGAYMLMENMPDETFVIVYLQPKTKKMQKEMALSRCCDAKSEEKVFSKRLKDEDKEFAEFERKINGTMPYPNCVQIIQFVNTYNEADIVRLADTLYYTKCREFNLPKGEIDWYGCI